MGSQSCLSPFLFFVGFSVTQCRELNSDNAYVAGTWSSVFSSVLFPLTILTILTTALRHGLQDHCTPLLVSRSRQRMLTDPGKDPMASLGPGGHYSTMRSDLPVPFPPQVTGACTDLKQAEQNKTPPVFQDEKRVIVLHFCKTSVLSGLMEEPGSPVCLLSQPQCLPCYTASVKCHHSWAKGS
jgi:hypothetical protein